MGRESVVGGGCTQEEGKQTQPGEGTISRGFTAKGRSWWVKWSQEKLLKWETESHVCGLMETISPGGARKRGDPGLRGRRVGTVSLR